MGFNNDTNNTIKSTQMTTRQAFVSPLPVTSSVSCFTYGHGRNLLSSSSSSFSSSSSPSHSSSSSPLFIDTRRTTRRRTFHTTRTIPTTAKFSLHPFSSSQASSSQSPNNNSNNNSHPSQIWNGLRKVIRVSTISASMLLSPSLMASLTTPSPNQLNATAHQQNPIVRRLNFSATAHAAPSSTTVSGDTTSDVEAAAMTLGAVTLGGLAMRVMLNKGRNQEAEQKRLADECERLQQEEHDRTKRLHRSKLESLDDEDSDDSGSSELDEASLKVQQQLQKVVQQSNSDLMTELRKRMDSLDQDDSDPQDEQDDNDDNDTGSVNDSNKKDTNMRHKPIPDRGTGSAVLERPDDDVDVSGNDDNSKQNEQDDEKLGKPDELEMLKRMWNLSPPEKEKE